jgi:8-oxo-dGTP diphosphatase
MRGMKTIRITPRAIIRRGDHLLVIHYVDQVGDWFALPGGGQQHGEDLHQTLEREVKEEIGIKLSIGRVRFIRECIAARDRDSSLPADFHQLEVFFECSIHADSLPSGLIPDANQIGVEWRAVDELLNMRFFPKDILSLLETPEAKYLGVC